MDPAAVTGNGTTITEKIIYYSYTGQNLTTPSLNYVQLGDALLPAMPIIKLNNPSNASTTTYTNLNGLASNMGMVINDTFSGQNAVLNCYNF